MRAVLLLTVAIALLGCSALGRQPKWFELKGYTFAQYTRDFRRRYVPGTDEYAHREAIFNRNLANIRRHNANQTHSWKQGVNRFTDMDPVEFKKLNKLRRAPRGADEVYPPKKIIKAPTTEELRNGLPLPVQVDYRQWNSPRVLTSVKDQGACGNCWAHAATESIESYFALLTGSLPVLSTQQITSCAPPPNVDGCGGGFASVGFMYINSTENGQTEEWGYPFVDYYFNNQDPLAVTSPCLNVTDAASIQGQSLTRAGVDGYHRVHANDAQATMYALATAGPLAISVAASAWQSYESGIMQLTDPTDPAMWQVDHAVQMVGYGFDAGLSMKYWIVRNSWGSLWGEEGFIRLERPDVEPCSPESPLTERVCGVTACLGAPEYPLVKQL